MSKKDKVDTSVHKKFVSSGQNPSGHITMDSQQARFFQEIMAKDHKLTKLQEWGLIEHKRQRNPLAAERSPRGEFIGFDFSIPKKEPEPERWTYPESDWGLMAKLRTQKPIYDVILQRERDEPRMKKEREQIRAANQARIQAVIREQKAIQHAAHQESLEEEKRMLELEEMMNNPQKYHSDNQQKIREAKSRARQEQRRQQQELDASLLGLDDTQQSQPTPASGRHKHHRSIPLDHFLDPNHDKTDHSSLAAVARSTKQNLQKIKADFQAKRSLEEFKIHDIKTLERTNPQVLAEYRASRAAQFIQKQGERALHPPPIMPADVPFFDTVPAFRGGGILQASAKELEVQARKNAQAKTLLMQGLKTSALRSLQHEQGSPAKQHKNRASSSASSLEMTLLQEQLAATENDIERQRLKMALKTKPLKSYEVPKETTTARASSARR
eukprot:gene6189-4447_t